MNASVAKKIDDILKLNEMPDTASQVDLPNHTISFEHVTFSYGEDQTALKDVSFSVPDGKVTALAGVSGSGKSTAASLICRFWDVTDGRRYDRKNSFIRIDGPDFLCNSKYLSVQKEHPGKYYDGKSCGNRR